MKKLIALFKDEGGATAVEYGIMVGLIAAAIIVTVGLLGTTLDGEFNKVLKGIVGDGGDVVDTK